MRLVTLRLVVVGKVQGVWYRDSMLCEAVRLNVAGWVRNRRDGTVEAMLQGDAEQVEVLVQWAHRGPQFARVERVEIEPGSGEYHRFEIQESV